MTRIKTKLTVSGIIIMSFILQHTSVYAEGEFSIPKILDPAQTPEEVSQSIQILLLLTVLALAPSIIIMMTSFTRIIIVLSFMRSALGTQQMPPNQILIGLALFLTFFIMSPVMAQMNTQAYQPYVNEEITSEQALDSASEIIKEFMFKHTREKDLAFFVSLSGQELPIEKEDVSLFTAVPAFLISELQTAFTMGFLIYIPFLIIDMIVASTLMSMGMMMIPPMMISLPFKLLIFVLIDGWNLVIKSVVQSFL